MYNVTVYVPAGSDTDATKKELKDAEDVGVDWVGDADATKKELKVKR